MENKKTPLWIYSFAITFTALFASMVLVICYKQQWLCLAHNILTVLVAFQFGIAMTNNVNTTNIDEQKDTPVPAKKDSIPIKIFGLLFNLAIFIGFFMAYKISIYDNLSGGVIKRLLLSILIVICAWLLPFIIGAQAKYWMKR